MSTELSKEQQEAASAAGWSPPSRLAEVVKERNTATERATNAIAEATAAKAAADLRATELKAWEGKAEAWEEERGIFRSGISDPEAVTVARAIHGALPAEGRPTLPAWLTGIVADPSKAPRALAPYLPSVGKAGTVAPEPSKAAAPGPRPAGTQPLAGAADAAAGHSEITLEQLQAARAELARGNPAPYQALRGRVVPGLAK